MPSASEYISRKNSDALVGGAVASAKNKVSTQAYQRALLRRTTGPTKAVRVFVNGTALFGAGQCATSVVDQSQKVSDATMQQLVSTVAKSYSVSDKAVNAQVKCGSIIIDYEITAPPRLNPDPVELLQALAQDILNSPPEDGLSFIGGDTSGSLTVTDSTGASTTTPVPSIPSGACPDGVYNAGGFGSGTLAGGFLTYINEKNQIEVTLPAISIAPGTYEITEDTALINCSGEALIVDFTSTGEASSFIRTLSSSNWIPIPAGGSVTVENTPVCGDGAYTHDDLTGQLSGGRFTYTVEGQPFDYPAISGYVGLTQVLEEPTVVVNCSEVNFACSLTVGGEIGSVTQSTILANSWHLFTAGELIIGETSNETVIPGDPPADDGEYVGFGDNVPGTVADGILSYGTDPLTRVPAVKLTIGYTGISETDIALCNLTGSAIVITYEGPISYTIPTGVYVIAGAGGLIISSEAPSREAPL